MRTLGRTSNMMLKQMTNARSLSALSMEMPRSEMSNALTFRTDAVMYKGGTMGDSFKHHCYLECTHLYIKDCSIPFIMSNINKTMFPKLKYISIDSSNISAEYMLLSSLAYDKVNILPFSSHREYHFRPINDIIFIGTKKV